MLRSFKTEIDPMPEQADKIRRTIGTCRFVYNLYVQQMNAVFSAGENPMSGYSFSKWLNNTFLRDHPEHVWIKDVSSKAVKQSIMNADMALKRYFRKQSRRPKFKKKVRNDVSAHFPKNNPKDCLIERHRIKVPTLGWVRLKEKGYLPAGLQAKSFTISMRAGRYFVSALVELPDEPVNTPAGSGLGIDLGLKSMAVLSDGTTIRNIDKTKPIRKLEKRLKRQQRKLSRKYESLRKRKKNMKGEVTRQNIQKQTRRIKRLRYRLDCIRTDHSHKAVNTIARTKPSYVTMEDLNIKGMMRNRHLAPSLQKQGLNLFRNELVQKLKETESGLEEAVRANREDAQVSNLDGFVHILSGSF